MGECLVNTDNFLIDNSDIEMAQNICKMITNTEVRNRAVANAIAGSIAAKFFDTEKYDVDSESGLHNIGTVLEDIDISDIYINGNYFDARVFFNEEEMSIPAAHFKNNLLPTAYMFIKINADLSGATVIGFVNPENVKMMNSVDGYYHINEDDLESFYDIEPLIVTVEDSVEVSDKDIFAFIDNTLEDKNSFYSELLKSKEGRIKLAKAIKAKNIFKFVSIADNNNIEANEIEENIPDFGFGDSPEISFESSGDLDLLSEENIDDLSLENPIVDDLEPSIDTLDSIEETSDLIDLEEKDIEDFSVAAQEDVLETVDEEFSSEINLQQDDSNEEIEIPNTLTDEKNIEDLTIQEDMPFASLDNEPSEEATEEVSSNTTFEYTTVASPSIDTSEDILEELTNQPEDNNIEAPISEENGTGEQIEALFNNDTEDVVNEDAATTEETPWLKVYPTKQKKSFLIPLSILLILIAAGALGYVGYTKFLASPPPSEDIINNETSNPEAQAAPKTEEAMPIESVEATTPQNTVNEAASETIPMIEQNLDASILVSNLKVEWEVPAAYTSNTSAKRYLTKLGKIIQLNLKTELLLLNKPPITNKIGVEIKYNRDSRKFEAVGITISSGENSVDALILQTVNKALAMNLSTNTDSFAKLQGNPVLIIHL